MENQLKQLFPYDGFLHRPRLIWQKIVFYSIFLFKKLSFFEPRFWRLISVWFRIPSIQNNFDFVSLWGKKGHISKIGFIFIRKRKNSSSCRRSFGFAGQWIGNFTGQFFERMSPLFTLYRKSSTNSLIEVFWLA